MKLNLILLFIALTTLQFKVAAQQITLYGQVTDQKNNPIAFVSVYIRNSAYGATTNETGNYQFKLGAGTYNVIYRYVGHKEKIDKITISGGSIQHNVKLEDEVFNLRPGIVNDRRGRDTAAYDIMRKVINKRQVYLDEVKSFSCAVYIKGQQRLTSAPRGLIRSGVSKMLDLDSSGRGILYQSESITSFTFALPNKIKEVAIASKIAGITPTFAYDKASDLQANFYENIFTINGLSSHGFVSPVAENAFQYYGYKLVGSTIENGRTIDKIELEPKFDNDPVFRGNIYILEGEWRIYSVDFILSRKYNSLNLVDTMQISQQYVPLQDNIWKPESITYDYKGSVFGFKFEGYYIGVYNNYKFNLSTPPGFFTGEIYRVDTAANIKPESYWNNNRPVPLTAMEARDYHRKDSIAVLHSKQRYLDSAQKSNNRFLVIPYLVFGHYEEYRHNKDSLFVYPFNQTLYYNTVEGIGINSRIRFKRTYDDFSSISISPALRYGFADKLLNGNVHAIYNYDPFNSGNFFFDFGSDVLDLSDVGTRSLYFNTLSTLLSEENYVKYYHSQFGSFGFQRELLNGLLWTANLAYAKRTQMFNNSYNHISTVAGKEYTSNNPLTPDAPAGDHSALFPQHDALTFKTSFQITFDQQYITRPTGKIYLPSQYPVVTLNYRKGINDVLNSTVNYDFLSVDVEQDHIPSGLFGYSAFKFSAGTFINAKTLYFMDYNHFLGNSGTAFDPTNIGEFHFLPYYTFSASGHYMEAHFQHNFSGALLRNIDFLRRLKLEEVVGANYLTERNNPNYSEFFIGLQRLIFRVDYGISYEGSHRYIQGFKIFYGLR